MDSGVWLPPLSGRGCCCSLSIRCLATHSIHDFGLLAHFKKWHLTLQKFLKLSIQKRSLYDYCPELLYHGEKKTGNEIRLCGTIQSISVDPTEIRYLKIRNCDHPISCPACGSGIAVKDSKRRYVKIESGRKLPFNLRRFYCANCDRIHTEIPDLITPYCQYDNATRERVKSGAYATFAGDDSTIRKWRKK